MSCDPAVVYLPDEQYQRLVEALEKIKPDAWVGDAETLIKTILGEIGGVWPASVAVEPA